MITYAFWGVARNGNKLHDYCQTKSTRNSKVLKKIEEIILDKYKLTFLDLVDFGFKRIEK